MRTTVAILVLAGVGVAYVANQPSKATACTLGLPIDQTGAATAQKARTRWLSNSSRGKFVDHPDKLSQSGDRVTAIYSLRSRTPGHTAYEQVVVERGDDSVWRVVDANRCESWTE